MPFRRDRGQRGLDRRERGLETRQINFFLGQFPIDTKETHGTLELDFNFWMVRMTAKPYSELVLQTEFVVDINLAPPDRAKESLNLLPPGLPRHV